MATATIQLPIPPHGFNSANPAGMSYSNGLPKLLFDADTSEFCYWQFRMPQNYASALTAKIQYSMASGVANEVEFQVNVMAVSDADAQDLDAESYDADNVGSATVPGTAGYMDEISITLTNADSLAAGDLVRIRLTTDADDAVNDDATGDREVWAVSLEYTTT